VTDDWFVVNARDARWQDAGACGFYCPFERDEAFPQLGINISVLARGQTLGYYHEEPGDQEGFLVLAGECTLIVEDETRPLRRWDFFHCPAGVAHSIVAAGDEPAIVLSIGSRGGGGSIYRVSEVARRYGVSVERETTDPSEAYAGLPKIVDIPYGGWLP
jgi:quercetin dioxygenase-like cupin family protein